MGVGLKRDRHCFAPPVDILPHVPENFEHGANYLFFVFIQLKRPEDLNTNGNGKIETIPVDTDYGYPMKA